MSPLPQQREHRPVNLSRVLNEIQGHPLITGAAVVGVALTLGAVLHYGLSDTVRPRRSLLTRLRRALSAWT